MTTGTPRYFLSRPRSRLSLRPTPGSQFGTIFPSRVGADGTRVVEPFLRQVDVNGLCQMKESSWLLGNNGVRVGSPFCLRQTDYPDGPFAYLPGPSKGSPQNFRTCIQFRGRSRPAVLGHWVSECRTTSQRTTHSGFISTQGKCP